MKEKDMIAGILAGQRLLKVEYRGSKVELIKWRDKESGRSREAWTVRHMVESGPDSIVVHERTDEGFDAAKWQAPLKKGQAAVFHCDALITEKGLVSGRGRLEVLE